MTAYRFAFQPSRGCWRFTSGDTGERWTCDEATIEVTVRTVLVGHGGVLELEPGTRLYTRLGDYADPGHHPYLEASVGLPGQEPSE